MTVTADELAMRREADRIGRRRTDAVQSREQAIARHPASVSKCPAHAAILRRVASLIVSEDLPPARLTVSGTEVLVDLSGGELVENGVRRWAAALDMVVTQVAVDGVGGLAATLWSASGYDGTSCWWHITGSHLLPTPMVDRFGVGVGPTS